ncbi:MAG: BtpA/SgcQ family protein [Candidatus Eiseniibacteriota bacterium]
MRGFTDLFGGVKPVIGMLHLPPLPGSPAGGTLDEAIARAQSDAEALTGAGVDGLIVENFGDAPFAKDRVPPVTVAAVAVVCREVRRDHNVPLGVNVLRNDALAALSIAQVTGCDFVRVNVHVGAVVADQGIIEGKARETLLLRRELRSDVLVFADVRVKHARPLGGEADLVDEARETRERGLADALILSGVATGRPADPADLRRVREALPGTPVLAGSGVTLANLAEFWRAADGMIVGSALKAGGDARAPVDPGRAREFLAEASRHRRS